MATCRKPKKLWFYVFVLVITLALLAFEIFLVHGFRFAEDEVTNLSDLHKQQLETFLEMNRLLTTLSTLAFGAMGAFIFQRYKSEVLPWYQIRRAVASWILSGASLYFGYLSYGNVLWMLQNNFFNLNNVIIRSTSMAQFWTFAIAIVLLADFVYHGLRKEER